MTPSTCAVGYAAAYCPFVPVGVNFSGVGESIVFGGVANYVVFDDVTFGSSVVGGIPEPSTWALSILGIGLLRGALPRRRRLDLVAA